MSLRAALLIFLSLSLGLPGSAQSPSRTGCDEIPNESNCKLLADFESYTPGDPPTEWRDTRDRDLVRLSAEGVMNDRKNVYVRREDGNQFARIHTDAKALRVVMTKKNGLNWDLDKRPILRWTWRAKALPEGANEKDSDRNDTGGALYVTLGTDWLGRPKSIKYTYSSTLPVGTTVDYGVLQVLVVASKPEDGLDEWIVHERNVVEDYKRLFDESPDERPHAVMMWSDSNTMNSVGTIDFDNLMFLSKPSRSADSATASSQ
jgi:hypothetical protein